MEHFEDLAAFWPGLSIVVSIQREASVQTSPGSFTFLLLLIPLHPLHDPLPAFRRIFIHLLLIPHDLLHLTRMRHIIALQDRRPLHHPIPPLFHIRKLLNVHASPACGVHPADGRDVGDGAFGADEVGCVGVLEVVVQDAVDAAGFVDVAVCGVLYLFGCVAGEGVRVLSVNVVAQSCVVP